MVEFAYKLVYRADERRGEFIRRYNVLAMEYEAIIARTSLYILSSNS